MNGTAGECFRTLGGVAHDEYGFAKTWSLLLNTTRVGEDDVGLAHEVHELEVLEGFDEEEVWTGEVFAKYLVDRLTHIWIEVHWINEIDLGILLREVLHGGHHTDEAVTKVLATMTGDEDKLLAVS